MRGSVLGQVLSWAGVVGRVLLVCGSSAGCAHGMFGVRRWCGLVKCREDCSQKKKGGGLGGSFFLSPPPHLTTTLGTPSGPLAQPAMEDGKGVVGYTNFFRVKIVPMTRWCHVESLSEKLPPALPPDFEPLLILRLTPTAFARRTCLTFGESL